MTDRPADPGRGPLTADGRCLYHSDLLPMETTLVARTGCVGCLLSDWNLDPHPVDPPPDADGDDWRCPRCGGVCAMRPTQRGAWVAVDADNQPHRHPVDFSNPFGLEAREQRRARQAVERETLDV